jgi:hypothetical protein
MSDGPRDQESDGRRAVPDPADEPTTGPPAGAASASVPDPSSQPGATHEALRSDPGESSASHIGSGTNPDAGTGAGARPRAGATTQAKADAGADAGKRRKRRLLVAGIAVAAAVIVIALCAGGLAVLRAVSGFRDDAADAGEDRRLRDGACLELEGRLNRLVPPGATTSPQARAVAVRDENAASRIYVGRLDDQRVSDGWRELLDARTSFAEALDAQAKSRTTAFFVAPAPRDGVALADQLVRWSPPACAGPIRRLAAPDL